jgi:hypothetical protein
MEALYSVLNIIKSYTRDHNLTSPFVTIPNSAQVLETYLGLADAAALFVMPIVNPWFERNGKLTQPSFDLDLITWLGLPVNQGFESTQELLEARGKSRFAQGEPISYIHCLLLCCTPAPSLRCFYRYRPTISENKAQHKDSKGLYLVYV